MKVLAKLVPAFNPVSFLTWIVKRDDLEQVNDWNNYSNWVYPDIPPYSTNIANKEAHIFGTAKEIAQLTQYLLDEKSKWITGQIINIDGGISSVKVN